MTTRTNPRRDGRDARPKSGEYFRGCRVVGITLTRGCFVCGGYANFRSAARARVTCVNAGERVVALFDGAARVSRNDPDSEAAQVTVGACDKHLKNLAALVRLTKNDIITARKIRRAQKAKP
ncbi:MAG: hypothetical protein HY369_01465 [Candidatus Aenigmarchaeota archaeon]|nr:hypothetical protein [Candidatus Aenigmarchaeota archaeon]